MYRCANHLQTLLSAEKLTIYAILDMEHRNKSGILLQHSISIKIKEQTHVSYKKCISV